MTAKVKTYGLFNLGRDDKPGSTNKVDLRILRLVKSKMPKKRWVLFFVEINEGDDNNERGLIRQVWPGSRLLDHEDPGHNVREPILLSPDLAETVTDVRVFWVPNTAVEHWSPQRSVLRVRLDDGETLMAAHFAAGAHGQGDRPDRAKGPLNDSWDALDRVHRMLEVAEHERGRDVTWMEDRNAYTKARVPDLPGQHTVVHERTDWGKVWAAKNHSAKFMALPETDIGLDSHKLLRQRGTYKERG